ncbi:MAG: pilus assembly protein [Bryobacterales bacterium]|nr:pilus assembly protein [Bryobacterales bacterium]
MNNQPLRGRKRRGNALVESALVLWPFMLLVFGIIQIGFVVWSSSTLAYAVDTATRHASLNGARSSTPVTQADLVTMVKDTSTGLDKTKINVLITWTPNNRPGSTVRIEATYAIETLVSLVWENPFTLKSASQMLIVN